MEKTLPKVSAILATIHQEHSLFDVPMKTDRIRKKILELSDTEDLDFIPSEMDEQNLRGFVKFYSYHKQIYGEPTLAANIYYSDNLNGCWKRFVHCKEMFHLLDEKEQHAANQEQVNDLIQAITSAAQVADQKPQEISERNALIAATELLFPWEHRTALKDAYADGIYSALDIAEMFKIPERYVATAMGERYSTIITKWRAHLSIEPLF